MFLPFLLIAGTSFKVNGYKVPTIFMDVVEANESGSEKVDPAQVIQYYLEMISDLSQFFYKFSTVGLTPNELFTKIISLQKGSQEEVDAYLRAWGNLKEGISIFDLNTPMQTLVQMYAGENFTKIRDSLPVITKETTIASLDTINMTRVNIIYNNWNVFSNFFRAANFDVDEVKKLVDAMHADSSKVTIGQVVTAFGMNINTLLKFYNSIYKAFTASSYKLSDFLNEIGADASVIEGFFTALRTPFETDNITFKGVIRGYATMFEAYIEVVSSLQQTAVTVMTEYISGFVKFVNIFDASVESRITAFYTGLDLYIQNFEKLGILDATKDELIQLRDEVKSIKDNGIPIQAILKENLGEEKTNQFISILNGIVNGTESAYQSIGKIAKLYGNPNVEVTFANMDKFATILSNPDNQLSKFYELIDQSVNNSEFNAYDIFKLVISEVTNKDLAFYNLTMLPAMTGFSSDELMDAWTFLYGRIHKLNANESETLSEEAIQIISKVITNLESNPQIKVILNATLGVDIKDVQSQLEMIAVALGKIDLTKLNDQMKVFMTNVQNNINGIVTFLKENSDITVRGLLRMMEQEAIYDEAIAILKDLLVPVYPKNDLKETYFLNQLKTVDNLDKITIPSVGNLINSIVCGEESLKNENNQVSLFDKIPLKAKYDNLTKINQHVATETLTIKVFFELQGNVNVSAVKENANELHSLLTSTDYSFKQMVKDTKSSNVTTYFNAFSIIANGVAEGSLKVQTIDSAADEINNMISGGDVQTSSAPSDTKLNAANVAGVVCAILIPIVVIAACIALGVFIYKRRSAKYDNFEGSETLQV